jgi:hypothetical protein
VVVGGTATANAEAVVVRREIGRRRERMVAR